MGNPSSNQIMTSQGTLTVAGPPTIGHLVRARREALAMTQARLAELVGLPAAQSISDIENGRRDIKAHELLKIARALHTGMDVLLGVTEQGETPHVLWRRGAKPEDRAREAQLLERAERYAQLEEWCGEQPAQPLPSFADFNPESATESLVAALAEQARRMLELGSIPAAALRRTLEESYGVKIFVEPLEGDQAGACVRSTFGSAILLNAADIAWRRNFSLAHELFHLMTWDAVDQAWKKARVEEGEPAWYNRLERLANRFAAHLLLPADSVNGRLRNFLDRGQITYAQIVSAALEFECSVEAFLYRLTELGHLERAVVKDVLANPQFQRVRADSIRAHQAPEQQSAWHPNRYERLAIRAFQKGVIGKSVVAKYLELPYAEVEAMNLGEPYGEEAALSIA